MLKHTLKALTFTMVITSCSTEKSYKDPSLSIDERVQDLLSKMTIEEKMSQMVAVNEEVKDLIIFNEDGTYDIEAVKKAIPDGIGQITRPSEAKGGESQTGHKNTEPLSPYENAVMTNQLQKFFIEETRLGIPAIFHEECLHGLASAQATSFPQPIAMAGTFNPKLIKDVYTMTAKETRLRGAHQALTPVVDVARDPRWGRVEETYGEDPYLISEIGGAAIDGFQGDGTFKDGEHVVATLKHFAAHGQPEGGTNTGPANYSERILREVHFSPFKNIIQKNGVLSVMTTYHEIDGVPVNANKWLVDDILRKEWGFDGFVVADYYAIREMHDRGGINAHRVARDGKHAAELAIKAGVNIELPNPDTYLHIPELIESGDISMERIDQLVGEMLKVKFKLGLFENPYVDPEKAKAYCATEENRALALETALQSITLLENKNNAAPIDLTKVKNIAVVGPNADRVMLGGYSGTPNFYTSMLDGIKNYADKDAKVSYAQGCGLTIGGSWAQDEVVFPTEATDNKMIKEAVRNAKNADVIVLALGGNEQTSREAWSNTHLGDRSDLDLIGRQNELINELSKLGKPMIAFVFNGRPLAFNNLIEKADAIFECWYLGQETGDAVAKVLFGAYNPGGKLPISFPRSAGHIPCFYNHKPTARRGYLNDDITALYPFGYGKSYTTFSMSQPRLAKSTIAKDESVKVLVDVKNTGDVKGDEVVQMYIADRVSSVTRPVKELKDFARITLLPGEQKTVELEITPEKLKFYDINMDFLVEAGEFDIMVGNSSANSDLQTVTLTVE